jgi:hypothetical protein
MFNDIIQKGKEIINKISEKLVSSKKNKTAFQAAKHCPQSYQQTYAHFIHNILRKVFP